MIRTRSRQAEMAALSVVVERRSGDGFSPINVDDAVQPGEAIRYSARGLAGFGGSAEFIVIAATGERVFEQSVSRALFRDSAWVDTVAPGAEGAYTLHLAQSAFLMVSRASFAFKVSTSAPPPPSGAPGGIDFGNLLKGSTVKWIAVGLVALMVLPRLLDLIPRGRR